MKLGPISSPEDLNSQWLTAMLRSNGDLDDLTSVAAAEVAAFGSEEAMMSSLHKVTMSFDGATEAPTSLIVKLTSTSEGARFVAAVFHFYEREVRFYNELIQQVSINAPRCLHAETYPEDQGFVVVLEELQGLRNVDQIDGLDFDDARTTIEALADLHAPFWGADLSHLSETILPFNSELVKQAFPMKAHEDWQKIRAAEGEKLPDEMVAVLDNVADIIPVAIDDVMGTDNTIVHGDSRADNLLFNPDGSVVLLDYQLMGIGHGMFDVAYLISQSLDTEAHDRADELIAMYGARLKTHGIELDVEEAETAYGASVIFNLGIALSILATEGLPDRGLELGRTMLGRASREAMRINAHRRYLSAV